MTHPKQNTQAKPNTAPLRLDEQLEQAKKALSDAKKKLLKPKENRFSLSTAKCTVMLLPRNRTYFDDRAEQHDRDVLPSNKGQHCRLISKIVKDMFPATRVGGAL